MQNRTRHRHRSSVPGNTLRNQRQAGPFRRRSGVRLADLMSDPGFQDTDVAIDSHTEAQLSQQKTTADATTGPERSNRHWGNTMASRHAADDGPSVASDRLRRATAYRSHLCSPLFFTLGQSVPIPASPCAPTYGYGSHLPPTFLPESPGRQSLSFSHTRYTSENRTSS